MPFLNSRQAKSKLSKQIILLKILLCLTPPPNKDLTLPIIHEISTLYKELYNTRQQIGKIDKFGLYLKIETIVINCLELAISAALIAKEKKPTIIIELKIKIEVTKRLVRLLWELKIITDKKYLLLEQKIIQASKMASGWQKYLTNRGSQ